MYIKLKSSIQSLVVPYMNTVYLDHCLSYITSVVSLGYIVQKLNYWSSNMTLLKVFYKHHEAQTPQDQCTSLAGM